jgi:integrase
LLAGLLQRTAFPTYLARRQQQSAAYLVTVHRFTDRWIQAQASADAPRSEYADALCPGLHLRVSGRGTKTFSAMLRVHGRLQRRTIGRYPLLSLAQARAAAMDMMRKAAEGVDPREPKPNAAAMITYIELVEAYFERHLKPNTRSAHQIERGLRHAALRHFHTRPAAGITRGEIGTAIDAVMASGKPQAANSLLRRLKMMFGWAIERDLIATNPCERLRQPAKAVERDRVLSDAEITAIWHATKRMPAPYGQMYRMFFLTGQRRSEVAAMQWSEVEDNLWVIPRERVKKDRAHTVPLTATAMATLASLPCYGDDAFVFTTTGGRSSSSNFDKMKRQVDCLSGTSGWTIHDIRRTVRSKLAEIGVPEVVAEKVINHETAKLIRIYDRHAYMAEKREALEKWETMLLSLTAKA